MEDTLPNSKPAHVRNGSYKFSLITILVLGVSLGLETVALIVVMQNASRREQILQDWASRQVQRMRMIDAKVQPVDAIGMLEALSWYSTTVQPDDKELMSEIRKQMDRSIERIQP